MIRLTMPECEEMGFAIKLKTDSGITLEEAVLVLIAAGVVALKLNEGALNE
jgi:hypothetical protein